MEKQSRNTCFMWKKGSKNMQHTMRSAFKRWLILHNEEYRMNCHIRIPNWFRWYVRKNKDWKYTVNSSITNYHCNICELDYEQRRRYKGYYTFDISDKELLQLQRAEWMKSNI